MGGTNLSFPDFLLCLFSPSFCASRFFLKGNRGSSFGHLLTTTIAHLAGWSGFFPLKEPLLLSPRKKADVFGASSSEYFFFSMLNRGGVNSISPPLHWSSQKLTLNLWCRYTVFSSLKKAIGVTHWMKNKFWTIFIPYFSDHNEFLFFHKLHLHHQSSLVATGHNVESQHQSQWRTDILSNFSGSVIVATADSVTLAKKERRIYVK